ncbi:type 2 isopentenyl-diphosphate Delta-isomerase [Candidatus Bathyarchaeota archaeon]|nr:MAG: type 2 isopentenyl-diphosphate Delta-isomerase [Candidatus Bathyarchaeota archaeon]
MKEKRIKKRKTDHIYICLNEDVEAKKITTGFEDIFFIHRALPELNLEEIDLTTEVFGYKFSAPIMISSITGGAEEAIKINASIAEAIEEFGLGMGVGSQRAALENPNLRRTYTIVRKKAPNAFLAANIGASQIIRDYGIKELEKIVEMIEADALIIHLNPLQEAIQPEGEAFYLGALRKIRQIAESLDVPIIVKETGAGISAEDAKKLEEAGVAGIDVAGAGGTSWAAVEWYRAHQRGDHLAEEVGKEFWDWGIPTAASVIEVAQSVDIPIIASGGVRSGLDIAKAISLGADLAGFALPILEPAVKGSEKVKEKIKIVIQQLRTSMFLVGACSIERLKGAPLVVLGKTAEWLRIRGFDIDSYARREG